MAVASAQIVAPYAGLAGLPYGGLAGLPYAGGLGYPYAAGFVPVAAKDAEELVKALPAPVVAAAPVAAAPVVSTSRVLTVPAIPQASQFQSQDEFGNLAYGYANHNSAKQEVGNTYGGVTGSYSYTDANGLVQTVNYIADGLGFRVQATNLPVAPVAELAQPVHEYELPVAPVHEYELPVAPVFNGVQPAGPVSVVDTPEVAAAKAEFLAAFDKINAREKRETPAATAVLPALPALPAALPYAGLAGLPYAAGLGYGGLGYAGLGHAGLGYAGLGYAGLAGLPAGLPYAGLAGLPYAAPVAAAPVAAPAAVVPSALATRAAVKTVIKNNPGFAESYIVN